MQLESRIISTISWCNECKPSKAWLGLSSPENRIRQSGLWLKQGLYGELLTEPEISFLSSIVASPELLQ